VNTQTRDNRLRVFIVEDSGVLVKRVEEWLNANPRVALAGTAADAETATTAIMQLMPDVVLLDIALAKYSNGFDVLRAIKRELGPRAPPFIVFSNHSTAPYRDAALRLGAAHFFDKNSDFTRMLQEVGRLAELRSTRSGSEG
jgi:DNA-binding NarL/FixJ family response regulator